MLVAAGIGGKALVIERRRVEAALELLPAPFVGGNRQQEPAPVAALVMYAQRAEGLVARRLRPHLVATQRRLHRTRIGPQPVRQQRGADVIALAGALALVQRGDDRTVSAQRRRMIAHPRELARRV